MSEKSKKQQDDHQQDDGYVDLPEDRLEQLGSDASQEEASGEEKQEKDSGGKEGAHREPKQDRAQKDATKKAAEKSAPSREDLLADIRESLAAEEEVEEPKGFFGRIKQRLRGPAKPKTEEPDVQVELETETTRPEEDEQDQEDLQSVLDELAVEAEHEPEPEQESKPKPKKKRTTRNKEEEKAIQEFFADLEALADIVPEEQLQVTTEERETGPEELEVKAKVPKLPVKSEAEADVDIEAVREVALQDYDETRVEPEERKAPIQEEVRETIRGLRPVERFLLIGFGVLTVGVLLFSGIYLIANSITIPTPTPTVEVDITEIVHPTRLTLPGGWEFNLGQGRVNEGQWTPDGAEWLVGTEISRWVALPWSLQLEAVLRTLKSDDQIELMMSNFDVLIFDVYSIQEMTMEQLLANSPTTPGLLVVLYNDEEADGSFWVVTALPSSGE